jgi:uncharacterized membrane protein YczE
MKKYLILTLVISILVGIILPFVLGIIDLTPSAITFSSVWFIYAVVVLIAVFLIKPGLKINVNRKEGITVVRYELLDSKRKEKSA